MNWPSDDQTSLVGLFGFGDDVEMNVRNGLEGRLSTKVLD